MLREIKYSLLVFGAILLMSARSKDDSLNPKHLNDVAIELIEEEDYDSAIKVLDQVIKLDPEFPDAYYNRGGCKQLSGNHRGAIYDFDKAIKLKPTDPDSYFNRGLSKYMTDAYRGAIGDFSKTITLDPTYVIAYYDRAYCEMELNLSGQACKDFRTAYDLGLKEAKKEFKTACKK